MPQPSATILENFRTRYGKDIDLTLRPAYRDLLAKLGNPHHHLPPVFHIAGTNGKGSTCAFLRAMLEAAGYRVHVYTSPHLVHFHERIRIAGQLITEKELADILDECEQLTVPGTVSYFEAATAAAFVAFARHAADFTILETGLGGRLDATNVVEKPLATIITRLSFDHREFLGHTMDDIAREKAGIMRPHAPCFTALQPESAALEALRDVAKKISTPLFIGGADWKVEECPNGFRFTDDTRMFDLPQPALLGHHQFQNAGLAIAALTALPKPLPRMAVIKGMTTVEWPARLQRLTTGSLAALVPSGAELWLDGGHNDSAGEVLSAQIEHWHQEDGANPKPLHIILGMLTTKEPAEFLSPFAPHIAHIRTVTIPNEPLSFTAQALADKIKEMKIPQAMSAEDIPAALLNLVGLNETSRSPRILICGSLYLAGIVLALSET